MRPRRALGPAAVPVWRSSLALSAVAGPAAGILWWLAAPGGAFYGGGTDINLWFPRDAVLALLLALAGVCTALFSLRARRRPSRR